MLEFTNNLEKYKEVKKQKIFSILPLFIIAAIMGIGYAIYEKSDNSILVLTISFAVFLIIATPIFAWVINKRLKEEKKEFESFRLTIWENAIVREQDDAVILNFPYDKIKSITKKADGSFIIINKDATELIEISQYVNDYEILEHRLSRIMDIEVLKSKTIDEKLKYTGALVGMTLFLITKTFTDKNVLWFIVVLITFSLIWGIIILKNHQSTYKNDKLKYIIAAIILSIGNLFLVYYTLSL